MNTLSNKPNKSNKPKKVIFFIGDLETEEVELHTPKRIFVYSNTINKNRTCKQNTLKYDKNHADFSNIFTWFVYEMVTFF